MNPMHWIQPERPVPEDVLAESYRRHGAGDRVGGARLIALHDHTLAQYLRVEEKRVIERVLRSLGGNRTHAADALGISREGLHKKIRALGIEPLRRRTG